MVDGSYAARVGAIGETWQVWAGLGGALTDAEWSVATRCPAWNVACVFAHHSRFPLALSTPLQPLKSASQNSSLTAPEVLRSLNVAGGIASTAADAIAAAAVDEAAHHPHHQLLERFSVFGRAAVQQLRETDPKLIVAWPGAGAGIAVNEALRIVLMEAVVHLLDVQRALHQPPEVPAPALACVARLLTEVAPSVDLIEAATGRSTQTPFPVLR